MHAPQWLTLSLNESSCSLVQWFHLDHMSKPTTGIEPVASSLPRKCSTSELRGHLSPQNNNGAGNGTRTRDPQLGRLTLYQLSYSRNLCDRSVWQEPLAPASSPGTTPMPDGEGRIRTSVGVRRQIYSLLPLATRAPPQLSPRPHMHSHPCECRIKPAAGRRDHTQSWRRDLNPRPADYKSAALPLSYASAAQTD